MKQNEEIAGHLDRIAAAYSLAKDVARQAAFSRAADAVRSLTVPLQKAPHPIKYLGASTLAVAAEFASKGATARLTALTNEQKISDIDLEKAVAMLRTKPDAPPPLPTAAELDKVKRDIILAQAVECSFDPAKTPTLYGELHVHTSWSSGKSNVLDWAKAAHEKGYTWLGISDHYSGLRAEVVGIETLDTYLETIEAVADLVPELTLYKGLELEITETGLLLIPSEHLSRIDYYIAGYHIQRRPKGAWSEWVERATRDPKVRVLAHAFREDMPFDHIEDVVKLLAARRVIVELNNKHLDISKKMLETLTHGGVRTIYSTDATEPGMLGNILHAAAFTYCAATGACKPMNHRQYVRW